MLGKYELLADDNAEKCQVLKILTVAVQSDSIRTVYLWVCLYLYM